MLTPELEASIPPAIRVLERDPRGYPVPFFVARVEGQPLDLRIADSNKRVLAFQRSLCWCCGSPLGKHRVFVGGPLSLANRTFSDWCSHEQCAVWAAQACPALNGTLLRRPGKEYPKDSASPQGLLEHIPPMTVLAYASGRIEFLSRERIFHPDKISRVKWWKDGVELSRQQALPILMDYLQPHGFDEADVQALSEGRPV